MDPIGDIRVSPTIKGTFLEGGGAIMRIIVCGGLYWVRLFTEATVLGVQAPSTHQIVTFGT